MSNTTVDFTGYIVFKIVEIKIQSNSKSLWRTNNPKNRKRAKNGMK